MYGDLDRRASDPHTFTGRCDVEVCDAERDARDNFCTCKHFYD